MIVRPGDRLRCFSTDLNAVEFFDVDGDEDVTVEISIVNSKGVTSTFNEKYAVIDNKLAIYGLDEVVARFFDFDDDARIAGIGTRGLVAVNTDINMNISFPIYGNMIVTEFQLSFANVELDMDLPCRMFLSRSMEEQALSPDGVACVNFWSIPGYKLYYEIGYVEGGLYDIAVEHFNMSKEQLSCFVFNWSDMLDAARHESPNLELQDLRNVVFTLRDLSGRIKDSVEFTMEQSSYEKEFAFIGSMGEVEVLPFHGSRSRSAKFEGTYLDVDDKNRKVSTEFSLEYEARTGAIAGWQRDLVYDMAESNWVYLIEDGKTIPVTILEVNVDETEPHTAPIALSVKYRLSSNRAQRTFSRTPVVSAVATMNDDQSNDID